MTKKERLLTSAKKLFANQGYDKTSIREIAEDAGANSALISYYFGGKEGILEGIFDHFFPHISDAPIKDTPLDDLTSLLRRIILLRIKDTELIDILHSEIIHKTPRMKAIKPYITASWDRLYSLLEQCQNQKLIQISSIDTAYMYLMAGISFPYHNPIFQAETEDINFNEAFVNELVHMLMKGLK